MKLYRTNFNNGGFSGDSVVKNPLAITRDSVSISESGRSPAEGNGNPLQYSCLGSPMDRGAWWAIVHEAAKSQTQFSDYVCVSVCLVTQLCLTLWDALTVGFSSQEYWSRLRCPSPEVLPNPGIEPVSSVSLALQVDSLPTESLGSLKNNKFNNRFSRLLYLNLQNTFEINKT